MDVGNPSNFARIAELYANDVHAMRRDVIGVKITQEETLRTIEDVHRDQHYTLDPHGAVGYAALQKLGLQGIVLETAHPSKFNETVEECIGKTFVIPDRLDQLLQLPESVLTMSNDIPSLKEFLLKHT